MTKRNYRAVSGLCMFLFVFGFFGIMHKLTLYLENGSGVPTPAHIIPFNDHGKMIYITGDQYGNLKIMAFVLVINLIITGVLAYKAKIPYGGDWLDK